VTSWYFGLAVFTQNWSMTDRQTDGQTTFDIVYRPTSRNDTRLSFQRSIMKR